MSKFSTLWLNESASAFWTFSSCAILIECASYFQSSLVDVVIPLLISAKEGSIHPPFYMSQRAASHNDLFHVRLHPSPPLSLHIYFIIAPRSEETFLSLPTALSLHISLSPSFSMLALFHYFILCPIGCLVKLFFFFGARHIILPI